MVNRFLALSTVETPDSGASATQSAELVLTVAAIGVVGVLLGGLIQLITQRWVIRYDRMIALRKEASDLGQAVGSYTSGMVQSAGVLSAARQQFLEDRKENPEAELELSEDYWNRLGGAFFDSFKRAQELSTSLQMASDYRIGNQAAEIHRLLISTHNHVAQMYTGELHLTQDEAKERQKKLNDEATVLLNMAGPRWWEGFWRFRSARGARQVMVKDRAKQAKKEATRGDGGAR